MGWDVVIYDKTMQTTQKRIIISYSIDENWPSLTRFVGISIFYGTNSVAFIASKGGN